MDSLHNRPETQSFDCFLAVGVDKLLKNSLVADEMSQNSARDPNGHSK